MTQRRIIIGDVHGHYQTLMSLLEAIAPNSDDEIYFLGDLIDRGPESAQVVDFVIKNNYACLLGNHEIMLLESLEINDSDDELCQAWLTCGGQNTIASYQGQIPPEHIEWMQNLPTYLDLGDIWLVHAGLNPQLPLEAQSDEEFCWIRDQFHSMVKPYFEDKLIITGHTITFTLPGVQPGKLAQGVGWLGIDTGVYHRHSGWLTALDITEKQVYQVNRQFNRVRAIPLEEAVTKINPTLVCSRRLRLTS